jgi:hypothetical protein
VNEAVPCSWAPPTTFPWHLSYEQPNPYTEGPNDGSVSYQAYSKIENNQLLWCAADKVMDYPYSSEPFDNFLLRQVDCGSFSGNDNVPDDVPLQCLLDNARPNDDIVLDADVNPGYLISTGLTLRRSGTTLRSTTAGLSWAPLWALPELEHPILQVADQSVTGYKISQIWFYGNGLNRTCHYDPITGNRLSTDMTNVVLLGTGFVIDQIESDMAVCASGVSVQGSGYRIQNSWFANNGRAQAMPPVDPEPWADGLTVLSCANGFIEGNHFIDNTDIDLITANSVNCSVRNNTIDHYYTKGYGGLMVAQFGPIGGVHTGTIYTNNVINALPNTLERGIMVGNHPWADNTQMDDVGTVQGNTATGAFFNLLIEADSRGIAVGSVTGNGLANAQGTPPFGNPQFGLPCTIPSNYVVNPEHAGAIAYDTGWEQAQFDSSIGCRWIQ